MKSEYRILFLLFCLVCFTITKSLSQVNAYAKVTAISGKVLTLSSVTETYHTFENGNKIIVMQMQDDVLGDVSNASTFGSLGSIKSAGIYEVATIASHTENSGLPNTITLDAAPTNTFNIGTNSTVQIISFRSYGNPDYTTTADMVAMDWNGTVGGVLAIEVAGTLTLAHNLTADAAGFIGGTRSGIGNSVVCDGTTWITNNNAASGRKGESIYRTTNTGYVYGRAKVLNGGGGGNMHNAGGGGGGNYTTGGDGGPGYLCSSSPVGGQGGISLSSSINASRIFMGGGGGGGQQNNGAATAGADGGGIILVTAKQIVTSGSCGTVKISANGGGGSAANTSGNDGAGGGGGGGSIVLAVKSFNIAAGCTLAISANGGDGGSVNDIRTHGGGGGGGQGVVIYSSAQPASNATTTTISGTGGCNESACTTRASTASGTANSGIVSNAGNTPLPVSLLYFKGLNNEQLHTIELRWATASESNNDYFTIERSANGEEFVTIGTVKGNGTSQITNKYQFIDDGARAGIYYYRLSQTDLDGTTVHFKIIRIEVDGVAEPFASVYPNPVNQGNDVTVDLIDVPDGVYTISIHDPQGIQVGQTSLHVSQLSGSATLRLSALLSGVYIVRISSLAWSSNRKLVIH
jgi:hypothetical protein